METKDQEIEINNQLLAGEKHLSNNWKFIEKTTTIPDKIGTEFGVEYKITNLYFTSTWSTSRPKRVNLTLGAAIN